LIIDAGQKKRWEPKEPERFLADEVARDTNLSFGARFAWDRQWQSDRMKKGYKPPVPVVEVEAPVQTEEEAWADEAAEIAAVAAAEAAPETHEAEVHAPEAAEPEAPEVEEHEIHEEHDLDAEEDAAQAAKKD
jgi:hypothetical protein